jgi:general secretion pathway protein G
MDGRVGTARQRGFTLIELLIVVAVVGIIAAIAVPNLLNALDRAKQKRTMADLNSVAAAVESYSVDNTIYPTAADMAALRASIEPVFMKDAPSIDGWGNTFIVTSASVGYTIGSGGRDGGGLNFIGGPTTNLNDAIIYINGQFVQWPEGSQQ